MFYEPGTFIKLLAVISLRLMLLCPTIPAVFNFQSPAPRNRKTSLKERWIYDHSAILKTHPFNSLPHFGVFADDYSNRLQGVRSQFRAHIPNVLNLLQSTKNNTAIF